MLRVTVRTMLRRPGYPAGAALILALGVGAATAFFAVVHAALQQPLPFSNGQRIAAVWLQPSSGARVPLPAPAVTEYAAAATTFDAWSYVLRTEEAALAHGASTAAVNVNVVAANLFSMLGVTPAAGRLFTEAEAHAATPDGSPTPVLLDHGFWMRSFGGAANVVGSAIMIDGQSSIVTGVLPAGFRLLLATDAGIAPVADVWRPIAGPLATLARDARLRDQDTDDRGVALARLAPSATIAQARQDVERIARVRRQDAASADEERIALVMLREDALAGVRPLILLLAATIVIGLLLTVANVAGLLAARTATRRRELAVRAALGSSQWQLVAPALTEALVIGAAAAAAGSVAAVWFTDGLMRLWPSALPLPADVRVDARVLAFAAGSALLAVVLSTLLPAWRGARTDALVALRSAGTVGPDARFLRIRNVFIVVELALSLTLLSGAGLLVRTFSNLHAVEPGFDATGVATFDLALIHRDGYRGPADRGAFVRRLEQRLRALPGVTNAGVIAGAPLAGQSFIQPWGEVGEPVDAWQGRAQYRVVTGDYFSAIGTRLLHGRVFVPADDRQDVRVVVVDETLAARLAPAAAPGRGTSFGDVIGRRIAVPIDGAAVEAEIVGVVENVRFTDLRAAGAPALYVPYRHEASRRVTVILRSERDAPALAPAVRAVVRELDPRLPVFDYRLLTDYVARATSAPRFALALLAAFAALASFAAGASIYALLAFSTATRTGEFGLRMTLGARRSDIVRLVLAQSLRLVAVALPLGLAVSAAAGQGLRGLLFGVSAADPVTAAVVSMLLLLAVFAASIRPALRASRVEPAEALRR